MAQIGRQAAQGLAYAHARGIVHRDIKPSNLLLDTAGVVWITDFGLAKAEDDGLTATGDILGTLRYMAPERFRGEGDARADVYALGLTLYELLTLRPAFDTPDRLRLIERIKTEDPARPRSLDARIPRDLETIVLKAIDKDPERRYATAEAMAEDLRRFLDDEPIQARRASPVERYARWARHHPTIATLGAVLTAVLVLTTLASLFVADRHGQPGPERAESRERPPQAETYHAVLSEARALRVGHPPGWREQALSDLARLATMPTLNRDRRCYAPRPRPPGDARHPPRGQDCSAGRCPRFVHFQPGWPDPPHCRPRDGPRLLGRAGERHLRSVESLTVGEGATAHDKVVYLPDDRGLAVGTDKGVVFTDTQGIRTPRAQITRGSSRPTMLAVDAAGRRVVVAWSGGAGVTVHDVASGDLLGRFADTNGESSEDDARSASSMAISLPGSRMRTPSWLSASTGDGSLARTIYDIVLLPVASGERRIVLGRHGRTTAVALSPDGAMLAAAFDKTFASASDHTTVLWDVTKREQLGVLRGHRGRVTDVAFSPDGEWIATGSFDYTTRIWEARTGQNVAILHASPITVYAVKWSTTGEHLAVSDDREIFLFKIAGRHRVQQWLTGQRIEQSRRGRTPDGLGSRQPDSRS